MSTTALHRRLRQQMPWLTPQWAGDDTNEISLRRLLKPYEGTEDDAIFEMQRMEGIATEPGLTYQTPENQARLRARGRGVTVGGARPLVPYDSRDADDALFNLRRLEGVATEPGLSYNTPENRARIRRPHLGGVPSGKANYRDSPDDRPGLVMPKLTARGYEERVIDPTTGAVTGFGDERDYAPLDSLPIPERDIPLLSRPLELPQLKRVPSVVHSEGRPTPIVLGTNDPEQQILARRRALEAYQPQKESKKSLALRAGLSILRGGLVGEGGVADTLLGPAGAFDRRGKDRAWQQGQIAQADESLGRMRTDRRAGLQDRLLESQVEKARTAPLEQERDNIRQIYNSQPYFDPNRSPDHRALRARAQALGMTLPSRDEKENFSLQWRGGELKRVNSRTGEVLGLSEPFVDPTRVPTVVNIGGKDFNVTQGQGASALATLGREQRTEERQLSKEQREQQTQASIAAAAATAARTKAENLRSNAANLENNAQHVDVVEAERLRAEAQQYRRQAYDADQEAEVQEGKVRAYSAAPPALTRGSVSAPAPFIAAFKKKHGRAPTQAEIEAYAQAANAR